MIVHLTSAHNLALPILFAIYKALMDQSVSTIWLINAPSQFSSDVSHRVRCAQGILQGHSKRAIQSINVGVQWRGREYDDQTCHLQP